MFERLKWAATLAATALITVSVPAVGQVTLNIVDVAGNLALTQDAIDRYVKNNPQKIGKVTYTKAPSPELPGKLKAMQGAGRSDIDLVLTGTDFLASTTATVFWWSLYVACAGAVLVFRVGLPLWRSLGTPLRVLDVRAEGPGVTTVTVGGSGVRRMPVRAGQFFQWRFLDGTGWTRGNPYSISAAPDGRTLRFTAAHVGDGSARLPMLQPGTRVLVEGPYGRMHAGVRARRKVLLMGSGIGITPMRALLEELDQAPGDVTVVHRVRSRSDAVLADEIAALAAARGARYLLIEGPRVPDRDSWLPAQARHLTDVQALREVVPDVADHDVYLCGSDGWMTAARTAAIDAGVPHDAVHLERFAY